MEMQEKKVIAEIKKMAKMNQMVSGFIFFSTERTRSSTP